MIITKTPFRMSFFGGGTDMESFFKDNGGAVLSTTFDKYCYVNVRHLPRFFDYSTELSYSKTERVTDINDIQHPAIRNAMKMLDMHEIRLTYEADLPARSGLGTSSSFAVGMLNAFYALKGKYADKKKLAEGYLKLLQQLDSDVEKMIKRDISVEIANYLTNNLTCYEKKNIDDEKTYETNFLHLMNVIGKNVINIPRKVHYSRELIKKMNEEFSKELCDLIKLFEKKFDKGESVKGYLSKKAFDVEFKDILLNQWGIKHLHYSGSVVKTKI
jgi:hypothetical protein